jgi:hypothetical protein
MRPIGHRVLHRRAWDSGCHDNQRDDAKDSTRGAVRTLYVSVTSISLITHRVCVQTSWGPQSVRELHRGAPRCPVMRSAYALMHIQDMYQTLTTRRIRRRQSYGETRAPSQGVFCLRQDYDAGS